MMTNGLGLAPYVANTWVVANPHILFRALRGFARGLLFRRNTLKIIEIFPTMACNLNCKMCSVGKFHKVTEHPLAIEDYTAIAKQGADMGAIAVTILGGEPFMADRLTEIIRIFRKEHFFVNMITNGTLVNRETLAELQSAGLMRLCFSLDSMDEEENDRIKGKGHFKKVTQALSQAREAGLQVGLSPIFFPGQLKQAVDVVRFCQKEGFHASAGQVAPVGAWEGKPLLSSEEHDRVRELVREYPRLTMDWAMSYFLKVRCPAGKEKVSIQTNGDVTGCSINPISFGNVRQEPLKAIVARMERFSQFAKDSPVCLAAEDTYYVEKYLLPLADFESYPVSYQNHPALCAEREPLIYQNQ